MTSLLNAISAAVLFIFQTKLTLAIVSVYCLMFIDVKVKTSTFIGFHFLLLVLVCNEDYLHKTKKQTKSLQAPSFPGNLWHCYKHIPIAHKLNRFLPFIVSVIYAFFYSNNFPAMVSAVWSLINGPIVSRQFNFLKNVLAFQKN
jgi:hypothetical protein